MYKTFAFKYRTTKADIIERYRLNKDFAVKYKDYKGNDKVRTFWKGSLARNDFPKDSSVDIMFSSKPVTYKNNPSLAKRLKANTCEWCGKYTTDVVMHQVRTIKDLDSNIPWNAHMIKINRKTLVVCPQCHEMIHAEYEEILSEKRKAYTEYREARQEMKDYQTAKYNIDRFLEREAVDQERDHQKERKREEPVL